MFTVPTEARRGRQISLKLALQTIGVIRSAPGSSGRDATALNLQTFVSASPTPPLRLPSKPAHPHHPHFDEEGEYLAAGKIREAGIG